MLRFGATSGSRCGTIRRMWMLRTFKTNRAITTLAILSLTLGIAADTSVFSIFNSLFLKSLPYPNAQQLVYIHESIPARSMPYLGVWSSDMASWREGNQSMTDIAAFLEYGAYLTGFGETARVT